TGSCANFRFRLFNRRENVRVSAASADAAAHPFADFVFAVRVTFLHTRDRGTNLTRCAVAALKSIMLDKCGLHWMEFFPVRQTFDCRDLVALMHDCERQARVNAATVHQHRACAALAMVASFL